MLWTSPSHEDEAAFPQLTVCVENILIARTLHQHCITDAGDAGEIRGCTSQTLQDTRRCELGARCHRDTWYVFNEIVARRIAIWPLIGKGGNKFASKSVERPSSNSS